jgi:hypothetical protein
VSTAAGKQPTKKKGLRIAAQAFDRITNNGRDGRI